MDKGKRELTLTEENLKLDEMIAHRDFLLQLVEDQNKRIRSLRLKQSLDAMAGDKNLMKVLEDQNLQAARSATSIVSTGG